jgi:hypothetical protein
MVIPRRIVSGNRIERFNEHIAFDHVWNTAGTARILVTDYYDANGVYLEYTKLITDVTKYPDNFIQAFAARLATHMAMPLSIRPDMAKAAASAYQQAIADAWEIEVGGFRPDPAPESEFIYVR